MTNQNLKREIEAASKSVKQAHLDRMVALGVSSTTIANLGVTQPPFGAMFIDDLGGGIFQPGGTIPSIVQPVYDEGCLIDIIGWQTASPSRWLWRNGSAWALGADTISDNAWTDSPLAIDATPLDWLRNGATGLCILNWDAPEIRALLRIKSISADRRISMQLRRALMTPAYFPKIVSAEGFSHVA